MIDFVAVFLAVLVLGATIAWIIADHRRNKKLAEIQKVANWYIMQSPWWKRWYQPVESYNIENPPKKMR